MKRLLLVVVVLLALAGAIIWFFCSRGGEGGGARLVPAGTVLAGFEKPPAVEEQKRIEEDLLERLSAEIRTAVFAVVKTFGVPENQDVVKSVARASQRVAKAVRPFAASGTEQAKSVAKGPRRATAKSRAQRRGKSRA